MQRRDRLVEPATHDPYRPKGGLPDPSVCPDCEATWRDGRWTWRHGPADAPRHRCSACARIRDGYPAGFVRLSGAFQGEHRDEIDALIQNIEKRERAEHPVNRIMQIREEEGELVITTTDLHLARAIGSAVESAYQGDLRLDYEEDVLRVHWTR